MACANPPIGYLQASALAAVVTISLVGASCRAAPRNVGTIRLIAGEPHEIWSRSAWSRTVEVFRWTFTRPEDLRHWRHRGMNLQYEIHKGALFLNWDTGRPVLLRSSVDIDACQVDVIEVTMHGLETYPDRLYWRREGESFRPSQWMLPKGDHPQLARGTVFTYSLANHPWWRGEIEELRFQFPTWHDNLSSIELVRGLKEQVDLPALRTALQQSWKVKLGNELRSGLVVEPSSSISFDVQIPEETGLWSAYGLWPYRVDEKEPQTVRFQVILEVDRRVHTVFEEQIVAKPSAQARWHPFQIDLSRFAGAQVRVRFVTSSDAAPDSFQALPVWAAPEISPVVIDFPNVLLISIDTLRADHMSLYGYPLATTPNLDSWARERGVVFEQAVAACPWTLPSHASILTGLDAISHGVNYQGSVLHGVTTLADVLRDGGYATAAFAGGGYLDPSFGLHRGCDVWRSCPAKMIELEENISRAVDFVRLNKDRPFFLFFHTFEVHGPFMGRQPYLSNLYPGTKSSSDVIDLRVIDRENDHLYDRVWRPFRIKKGGVFFQLEPESYHLVTKYYDAGVSYTDDKLAELIKAVEDHAAGRGSLIVMTADHGEHLGERGLFGHFSLYDGNLRVPLVISYPGVLPPGLRIGRQVRSIDIMPTILDLVRLPIPAGIDGASLVDIINGKDKDAPAEVWSYNADLAQGHSLRIDNRVKYIFNNSAMPGVAGREELYYLETDPGESTNLATGQHQAEPDLSVLRSRVTGRAAESSGLHMTLFNATGRKVQAIFSGERINRRQVKTNSLPPDTVRWKFGFLVVDLQPGARLAMVVEDAGEQPVLVRSTKGGEDTTIWPLPGKGPWRFNISHGDWRLVAADASETGSALLLSWKGRRSQQGRLAAGLDNELAEQLRELGYIE